MFKKEIIIYSSRSKEETIAVLAANVEPWHKDSSLIPFEGSVTPEGRFNIKLGPATTGYRTRVSIIQIEGAVAEDDKGKVLVEVKFSFFENMQFFLYIIPFVLPLVSILLYTKNIGQPFPWFIPLIFIPVLLLSFYLTFRADVQKAEKELMFLLT